MKLIAFVAEKLQACFEIGTLEQKNILLSYPAEWSSKCKMEALVQKGLKSPPNELTE